MQHGNRLYQSGKLKNLGISEIQTSKLTTKNGMMYYIGNSDSAHRYRVAILLAKETNKSGNSFTLYSERIVMVQLNTNIQKTNLIQVQATKMT